MKKNSKYSNVMYQLFIFASILVLYRFKFIDFLAYGIVFIGFFCLLLSLNYRQYKINYLVTSVVCFFLFMAGIFYILSDNQSDSMPYYYTLFMVPFLAYYSTIIIVENSYTEEIIHGLEIIVKAYIVFLVFDAAFRYGYALYTYKTTGELINSFYTFKFSPVTAGDTNFMALRILFPMCLLFYLEKITKNKKWNIYIYIFYFFIILTLSRAVIITGAALLLLRYCIKLLGKKYYTTLFFIVTLIIVLLSLILVPKISGDGSFKTKLGILESLKTIPEKDLSKVIFGFGINEGRFAYSFKDEAYGHSHMALIIGQFGILGLLVYIIFFSTMLYISRFELLYIMLAFLMSGFSLMEFGPNFFWCLGIMNVLRKRFKNTNAETIYRIRQKL